MADIYPKIILVYQDALMTFSEVKRPEKEAPVRPDHTIYWHRWLISTLARVEEPRNPAAQTPPAGVTLQGKEDERVRNVRHICKDARDSPSSLSEPSNTTLKCPHVSSEMCFCPSMCSMHKNTHTHAAAVWGSYLLNRSYLLLWAGRC